MKDFVSFANQAAYDGFIRTLWCSTGGSRLLPQVVEETFGVTAGGLDLRLFDTSDPGTITVSPNTIWFGRGVYRVSYGMKSQA